MVNKQSKGKQIKIKIGGDSNVQATNCLFQIHHSLNNQAYLLGIVFYETFLGQMSLKEKFSEGDLAASSKTYQVQPFYTNEKSKPGV